jgi:hypothetical protein
MLVDNSVGAALSSSPMRAAMSSSITDAAGMMVRFGGGPPFLSHSATVAGW